MYTYNIMYVVEMVHIHILIRLCCLQIYIRAHVESDSYFSPNNSLGQSLTTGHHAKNIPPISGCFTLISGFLLQLVEEPAISKLKFKKAESINVVDIYNLGSVYLAS